MFRKSPDDPFFEEMDEWTWAWMYQSWLQDKEDEQKTFKDYALFLGSFSNLEMAQKISKQDNPDYESSEEDAEKSVEVVRKVSEFVENKKQATSHRRRRKVLKD